MEIYRGKLRTAALRMLRDEDAAEDVVQEAFLRWYACAPTDLDSPLAWLLAVVRNLCVDAYRRKEKESPRDHASLAVLAAAAHEPDYAEITSDIACALHELAARATADESAALLLREAFEFSYPEMSAALGKSQQACRQLVHRGKRAAAGCRPRRRAPSAVPPQLVGSFVRSLQHPDPRVALGIVRRLMPSA